MKVESEPMPTLCWNMISFVFVGCIPQSLLVVPIFVSQEWPWKMLGLHRWERNNVCNLPVSVGNRPLNSKSSRNKAVRPSSLPVKTRGAEVSDTESSVKSGSFKGNPKGVLTYGASTRSVRQDDSVKGDDVLRRGGVFQMKT